MHWEYEDGRKWLPYSEILSELLTDRYNGGDTEVSFFFFFFFFFILYNKQLFLIVHSFDAYLSIFPKLSIV